MHDPKVGENIVFVFEGTESVELKSSAELSSTICLARLHVSAAVNNERM